MFTRLFDAASTLRVQTPSVGNLLSSFTSTLRKPQRDDDTVNFLLQCGLDGIDAMNKYINDPTDFDKETGEILDMLHGNINALISATSLENEIVLYTPYSGAPIEKGTSVYFSGFSVWYSNLQTLVQQFSDDETYSFLKFEFPKGYRLLHLDNLDAYLLYSNRQCIVQKGKTIEQGRVIYKVQDILLSPKVYEHVPSLQSKEIPQDFCERITSRNIQHIDGQSVLSFYDTMRRDDTTNAYSTSEVVEDDDDVQEGKLPWASAGYGRTEEGKWKTLQNNMIKYAVPSISSHGVDYFALNKGGIEKKLVMCDWNRENNEFSFPEPGNGDFVVVSVEDKTSGKSFIVKSFYEPHYVQNGNLVEALIYTKIIAPIIEHNMTPHVVTPYAHVYCPGFFDQLSEIVAEKKPKQLTVKEFEKKVKQLEKSVRDHYGRDEIQPPKLNNHVLCIEKVAGKIYTLEDILFILLDPEAERLLVIGDKQLDVMWELKMVIFQILYTFHIFNRCGLRHNDIHAGNVLIQFLDDKPFVATYIVDGQKFYVNTRFHVYIIDYDKSTVNDSPLLKSNVENNPFQNGSIFNTRLEQNDCSDLGNCNTVSPKADLFKFCTAVLTIMNDQKSTDHQLKQEIESWVSSSLLINHKGGYLPVRRQENKPDYNPPDKWESDTDWMMSPEEVLLSSEFFKQVRENVHPMEPEQVYEFKILEQKQVDENVMSDKEGENSLVYLMEMNNALIQQHVPYYTIQGIYFWELDPTLPVSFIHTGCSQHFKLDTLKFPILDEVLNYTTSYSIAIPEKKASLKIFPTPSPFDNGNFVEALIYTNIISPLLALKMTPHLLTPLHHYICTDIFGDIIYQYKKEIRNGTRSDGDIVDHILQTKKQLEENLIADVGPLLKRDETQVLGLQRVHSITFSEFLKLREVTSSDIKSVMLQIIYTLHILNLSGLRHNNLVMDNILIEKKKDMRYNEYYVDVGTVLYSRSEYHAYIVNFDKASVTNSVVLQKMNNRSPLANGNLRNTTIEKKLFLKQRGMHNGENPKVDTLVLLKDMYSTLKKKGLAEKLGFDIEDHWISSTILTDDEIFKRYLAEDHIPDRSTGPIIWMLTNKEILQSSFFESHKERCIEPTRKFQFTDRNLSEGDVKLLRSYNNLYQNMEKSDDLMIQYHVPTITQFGKLIFGNTILSLNDIIDFGLTWWDNEEISIGRGGLALLGEFTTPLDQECMIKLFYRPSPADNSSLVEAIIYTQVIEKMLRYDLTPHLPKPYFHTVDDHFDEDEWKNNPKLSKNTIKKFDVMSGEAVGLLSYYPFQDYNAKKYLSKLHMLCFEKIPGVQSFQKFAYEDENTTAEDYKSVVFQVLYTLYIFNICGLRHNDLHTLGNILVQKLNQPVYHKYIVGDKTFFVRLDYKAYIIDFDRASVSESKWLRHHHKSDKNDPLSRGNIRNTHLDSENSCMRYGTCNEKNGKADTFKFLLSNAKPPKHGFDVTEYISDPYLESIETTLFE